MKEKKRLEVFWETHEITMISFRQKRSATIYCQSCGTETLHLTIAESASITKFSESAIFRFVETNQIHSIESPAGFLLVCGNSLSALTREDI
jgi:hypothetical protein